MAISHHTILHHILNSREAEAERACGVEEGVLTVRLVSVLAKFRSAIHVVQCNVMQCNAMQCNAQR